MKTTSMESFKNNLSLSLFGRSLDYCKAHELCVSCGKLATHFRDQLSIKEYDITGMCQGCQDKFFEDEPAE